MSRTAPPTESAPDALVPDARLLGRYQLRFRVARGGMATVYLARLKAAKGFEKWLAVKTIHPHVADESHYIEMFLDEARLAARINHPNVCAVFDVGESEGTYYLAMEYLHGQALSALMRRLARRDGLPPAIAARIVADAARGLHAAHELRGANGALAGVVHRDVSPQNIFVLYDGVAKVVDFGIAKSNDHLREQTSTTELKGKLTYMAPEQLHRATVDRRADLWALGVVLWETTIGRRLFHRGSEIASVNAIAHEAIPLPSAIRPEYPRGLEEIVMRALQRDPQMRYQTAADMALDLERFLASLAAPVTHGEVSAYMHSLFRHEMESREALLRASEPGLDDAAVQSSMRPSAAADPTREIAVPPAEATLALPPALDAPRPPHTNLSAFETEAAQSNGAGLSARPDGNRGRTTRMTALGVGVLVLLGAALLYRPEHLAFFQRRSELPSLSSLVTSSELDAGALRVVTYGFDAAANGNANPAANVIAPPMAAPAAAIHTTTQPSWHMASSAGLLSLTASPDARVYEAGRLLGSTPWIEQPMRPGTHVLRLVPLDGRRARSISVTIRASHTTSRHERW